MLVYGDQRFTAPLNTLLDAVLAMDTATLQQQRELLIRLGQIEQAAYDQALPFAENFQQATRLAAQLFYQSWQGQVVSTPSRLYDLLNAAHQEVEVTLKVPEGFAFYALYPEQYILAAEQWMANHPTRKKVLVVGLRSIGTTLGAVVSAVLEAAGYPIQYLTVRPTGHPFQREVILPPIENCVWGLVVDEGPGQSGSSMAAVAEAMAQGGIAPEHICFLPGHANDPGSAANEQVRQWWAAAPRYVSNAEAIGIKTRLAAATAPHFRVTTAQIEVRGVYPVSPFDRLQYICTAGAEKIIWNFAGLMGRAEQAAQQHEQRGTFAPALIAVGDGFIGIAHVEGQPLTITDKNRDLLRMLARYIRQVAQPFDDPAAFARLSDMLYRNVQIMFDDTAAHQVKTWVEALPPFRFTQGYGDGNLAPEKWIVSYDKFIKLDSTGRQYDHTLIQQQPVAWDIASAIVEWDLDSAETAHLLSTFYSAGGEPIPADHLRFYCMAYAAFRCGVRYYEGQNDDFYRVQIARIIDHL